jgi:hypothetical protein
MIDGAGEEFVCLLLWKAGLDFADDCPCEREARCRGRRRRFSHVRHTGRAVEPAVIEERPILVQRPLANSRPSRSQVAEPSKGDVATKRAHKRSFAELSVKLFESCTPRGASEGAAKAPVTQGLGGSGPLIGSGLVGAPYAEIYRI